MDHDQARATLGEKIREIWSGLNDDDLTLLDGKRDQFFGRLQEIYGIDRHEAEKRLRELEESYDHKSGHAA